MSLIKRAKEFANKAHEGQFRKFSALPYFIHPENVAKNVLYCGGTDEMIAAAYLHDTIEDCGIDYSELVDHFGEHVALLVSELTNDRDKLKEMGKKEYLLEKLSILSNEALTIKLCDFYDNSLGAFYCGNDEFFRKIAINILYVLKNLKRKLDPLQKRIYDKTVRLLEEKAL